MMFPISMDQNQNVESYGLRYTRLAVLEHCLEQKAIVTSGEEKNNQRKSESEIDVMRRAW